MKMQAFGTGEASEYLISRGIEKTQDEVYRLAKNGGLECFQLTNKRIMIPAEELIKYADNYLASESDDGADEAGEGRHDSSVSGRNKKPTWRRLARVFNYRFERAISGKELLILGFIGLGFLFLLGLYGLHNTFSVVITSMLASVVVTYLLSTLVMDGQSAFFETDKLSFRGAFGLFALLLLAFHVTYWPRSELVVDKENALLERDEAMVSLQELNTKIANLEDKNTQYLKFHENMGMLFENEEVNVPMDLVLTLECKDPIPVGFWYSESTSHEKDTEDFMPAEKNSGKITLDMRDMKKTLLLHRTEERDFDRIARVYFDNSSLIKPTISVVLHHNKLCADGADFSDRHTIAKHIDALEQSNTAADSLINSLDNVTDSDSFNVSVTKLLEKTINTWDQETVKSLEVLSRLDRQWGDDESHSQLINKVYELIGANPDTSKANVGVDALNNSTFSHYGCSTDNTDTRFDCLDGLIRDMPALDKNSLLSVKKAFSMIKVGIDSNQKDYLIGALKTFKALSATKNPELVFETTLGEDRLMFGSDIVFYGLVLAHVLDDSDSYDYFVSLLPTQAQTESIIGIDNRILGAYPGTEIFDLANNEIFSFSAVDIIKNMHEIENATDEMDYADMFKLIEQKLSDVTDKGYVIILGPYASEQEAKNAMDEYKKEIRAHADVATDYSFVNSDDHFRVVRGGDSANDDVYFISIGPGAVDPVALTVDTACSLAKTFRLRLNVSAKVNGPGSPSQCIA